MPKRIRLSRKKGWRLPEGAVVVSRPSRWGNKWTINDARQAGFAGSDREIREWCIALYRHDLMQNETLGSTAAIRNALRGKDLACWCPLDQPCHADLLLEIANA